MTDLHDVMFEIKEWVAIHDALLEPVIEESYASADDLFKALGINA